MLQVTVRVNSSALQDLLQYIQRACDSMSSAPLNPSPHLIIMTSPAVSRSRLVKRFIIESKTALTSLEIYDEAIGNVKRVAGSLFSVSRPSFDVLDVGPTGRHLNIGNTL
jgi:hypothetical protein